MHDSQRQKLIDFADSILKFQELELTEQLWLLPMMNRGIKSTLEILDYLTEGEATYEEIASELNLNDQTVRQKLNALAIGGYPLDLQEHSVALKSTGRGRVLARIKRSEPD